MRRIAIEILGGEELVGSQCISQMEENFTWKVAHWWSSPCCAVALTIDLARKKLKCIKMPFHIEFTYTGMLTIFPQLGAYALMNTLPQINAYPPSP